MQLSRNTFEKLNARPSLLSTLSRSAGQRRKGGLQHRTHGVWMAYIHRQHGHRQRPSFYLQTCKHHTATQMCSCLPPSRLSAFITGRPLTPENFFRTEAPPAPRPAPACCLSQLARDLSHRVLPGARCQALPFRRWLGRGRQQVVQEVGSSSCTTTC